MFFSQVFKCARIYRFDAVTVTVKVTGGDTGFPPIRAVWVVLPAEQESPLDRGEGGRERQNVFEWVSGLKIAQLVETPGCKRVRNTD